MKLTHVTITGVDDHVSLRRIEELSSEHADILEWGVLFSQKRKGTPRYPSPNWLSEFVEHFSDSDAIGRFSAHMCGVLSDKLTEDWHSPIHAGDYFGGPPLVRVFDRVQLNGFPESTQSFTRINALASRLNDHAVSVILPVPNQKTLDRVRQTFLPNVHFLHDRSRGRGIVPTDWPDAELDGCVGFAGGITQDNIRAVLDTLCERPDAREFWLDLESGARTEDRLDFDKVEAILKVVEEYAFG